MQTICRINYSTRTLFTTCGRRRLSKQVAVALSGGIDSSVCAYLLQQQGHDVVGVYMRNWDNSDENASETCTSSSDYEDAKQVCEHLGIRLLEVSFVREYWNDVFVPFLDAYESGSSTPNPDVSCNRYIKFSRLQDYIHRVLGIKNMATGHYVRLSSNEYADTPRLLRGIDSSKDQSYFLSTTEGRKFKDVIFPVGDMTKKQVRTIAESVFAGLRVLDKKESMGVCFIGKRDIGNFLSNYVNVRKDMRCRFIDVTDGKVLEDNITNNTAMFYTLGQGAKIGGKPMKYFVVSKLISNCFCDIYVAPGSNHPSLYSNTVEIPLSRFNWISGNIPIDMFNHTVTSTSDSASWCVEDSNNEGISMVCECQFRHLQEPLKCRVRIVYKSFPMQHFQNDKKLSPLGVKYLKENSHINTRRQFEEIDKLQYDDLFMSLRIDFSSPVRAAVPGQILVLYKGDVCLGGGAIQYSYSAYFDHIS